MTAIERAVAEMENLTIKSSLYNARRWSALVASESYPEVHKGSLRRSIKDARDRAHFLKTGEQA